MAMKPEGHLYNVSKANQYHKGWKKGQILNKFSKNVWKIPVQKYLKNDFKGQ